jgi:hypothetical protein
MSLARKIASFARSPQGRKAIDEARTRLDTPENRKKVTSAFGKVRNKPKPQP